MTTMTPPTGRASILAAQNANWVTRGACRTVDDPDLFYPVGGSTQARQQANAAKAVCAGCTVKTRCLEWALATRQDEGVLGGLTEEERRAIHKRRPRSSFQRKAAQHIIRHRLPEFEELMGQGLEPLEVAKRMGTNVQTVNNVLEHLAAQAAGEREGQVAA